MKKQERSSEMTRDTTSSVIAMPPRIWKPTAAELCAIRAYCAETERRRPGAITIEAGIRQNFERADLDGIYSVNIWRVTDHPNWDDTDLTGTLPWADFRAGVELDAKGRVLVDFYIYGKRDDEGLLGNAQVYVETREGAPRIVGFSATQRPYEDVAAVIGGE